MPRLENWSIVSRIVSPYQAPELGGVSALSGKVYNHQRFKDGAVVTTSKIINRKGDKIITHSGSIYELGVVAKDYEELYPNAKERLLITLKEKE